MDGEHGVALSFKECRGVVPHPLSPSSDAGPKQLVDLTFKPGRGESRSGLELARGGC